MSAIPLFDRSREVVFSVGELTGMLKGLIEESFPRIGVAGEISNAARPRSGHVYFTLKDESAQLRAVMWRSDAQRLVFDLTDGLAVRAWGGLTVYPQRGDYQLIVRKLEPEGIGALELALRQTTARLAAEGLFDPARKRRPPRFPRRIVMVTSPTGAAIRDFLRVIARRWDAIEILIIPVRVQGEGAASEIAAAIATANRIRDVDVIVLARGGGSLEDLWAFNEEITARAIFASSAPVVSAIGHEIDVTIADLVADVRALTPSQAGELCVPDRSEILSHLEHLRIRLARGGVAPIERCRSRLDQLEERSRSAIARLLDRKSAEIARYAASLEALSPLAVLARGYSATFLDGETTPLHDASRARAGDTLRTRLERGMLTSRVESIELEAGTKPRATS
jgi:exodeoxyribonuclease VII large subunit